MLNVRTISKTVQIESLPSGNNLCKQSDRRKILRPEAQKPRCRPTISRAISGIVPCQCSHLMIQHRDIVIASRRLCRSLGITSSIPRRTLALP